LNAPHGPWRSARWHEALTTAAQEYLQLTKDSVQECALLKHFRKDVLMDFGIGPLQGLQTPWRD
jgi:hypothetical protein